MSLLTAPAVAAGALTLSAAASQVAPTFGLAAMTERTPSLVDPDVIKTGSITTHKLVRQGDNDTREDSDLLDPDTTGIPLADATSIAEKFTPADLTKQEGQEKLASYHKGKGDKKVSANATAVEIAHADGVGTPVSQTMDADGLATFNNLVPGAYIVTETQTPAGCTGSHPLITTVSMIHSTEPNKWACDVHAYLENTKANVEKGVGDTRTPVVGSPISCAVTAGVPDTSAADYCNVVGQCNKHMGLPKDQIELRTIEARDGDVPLVKGKDYTLIPVMGKDDEANFWTAEFTEADRKKMIDQRKGNDIKIAMPLEGTFKEKTGDEGLIENKTILLPDAPANNWKPGNGEVPPPDYPNTKVASRSGKVMIIRASSVNETKKLQGTEFRAYRYKPTTKPASNFESVDVSLDTKLTAGGRDIFVIDDQGKIAIDGLRNSDWEDDKAVADPDYYCLVETKTPDNFELQSRPIVFRILAPNSTKDNKYTLKTTIKGVPKNGGLNLPLTGAVGVGVLVGADALLVTGSNAIALANEHRKEQADA